MYAWEAKTSLCLQVQSYSMHTICTTAVIFLVEEVWAETHQRLSPYKVYSGSVRFILIFVMHLMSEMTESAWTYFGCAGILPVHQHQ
jgi:hypothetical protein